MDTINVKAMVALIFGVIYMVVGLIFAGTIIAIAASSGTIAQIGSFLGAQNMNDIFPFLYYALLLISSMAIMLAGVFGVFEKGPLRSS